MHIKLWNRCVFSICTDSTCTYVFRANRNMNRYNAGYFQGFSVTSFSLCKLDSCMENVVSSLIGSALSSAKTTVCLHLIMRKIFHVYHSQQF